MSTTDEERAAERRLIIILSIIAVVTIVVVGVLLRELYYGAYPHLRPQSAVSAGRLRRDAYAPHYTSVGAANLMIEAADLLERQQAEIERLSREGADHEAVHASHRQLVRRLDVILNGETGAAPQARLCDVVAQLERLSRERDTGVPTAAANPAACAAAPAVPSYVIVDTPKSEPNLTPSNVFPAEPASRLSAAPQPPTVSTQGDMLIPMGRENDGDKHVTAYMCLIDFECELGLASGGNRVYPSIEDIREHSKCVGGCGIVEVEVRATRVVQEPSDEGELVMTAAEIEAAEHSPPSPQPDLSTLTRERDQAREALKPFAKVLDAMEHDNQLCEEEIDSVLAGTGIVPSDLRRARSVLHPDTEVSS